MGKAQDRGYHGEQTAGFVLGQKGYMFVDGPSGSGGHQANARGFDGVAYNPKKPHLIIYDNKAFKKASKASSASALTTNLIKNIVSLIANVKSLKDLPFKEQILKTLVEAHNSVKTGKHMPEGVEIVITNAGGNVKGVSERLKKQHGIGFMNLNPLPNKNNPRQWIETHPPNGVPKFTTSRGSQPQSNTHAEVGLPATPVRMPSPAASMQLKLSRARGAAELFSMASIKFGQISFEAKVRKELNSKEIRDNIARTLLEGFGVLIILRYELEKGDLRVDSRFLGLYTQFGNNKEDAEKKWVSTPKILQGSKPSSVKKLVTEFIEWIPPIVVQSIIKEN